VCAGHAYRNAGLVASRYSAEHCGIVGPVAARDPVPVLDYRRPALEMGSDRSLELVEILRVDSPEPLVWRESNLSGR